LHDFALWLEIGGVPLYVVGDSQDGISSGHQVYLSDDFETEVSQILNSAAENEIEEAIRKHLELHHTENPDLP
jgi:hypothetical protein